MATHIKDSRKAVRKYLKQQWDTMFTILGNPETGNVKDMENYVAFEKALSFPYNQKLAFFPADASLERDKGSGRARGEFGKGSLIPSQIKEEGKLKLMVAHQSAILASLYARQEFIRAAARMPMTLFVGPSSTEDSVPKFPGKNTSLLTSEKFSRVVFSGIIPSGPQEYVAVAQFSRTYPQTAVVRIWTTAQPELAASVIKIVKARWVEIAGDKNSAGKILLQRGKDANKGIPLLTRGLVKPETQWMYMHHTKKNPLLFSRVEMWTNVIALTASDRHGDTNLWQKDAENLWGSKNKSDNYMKRWQWMAAMLALRRIPYIVKSEDKKDANRDPLPHALTQKEAETVKSMMGAIIIARSGGNNTLKTSSSKISNKKMGSRRRRVVFSETTKWW